MTIAISYTNIGPNILIAVLPNPVAPYTPILVYGPVSFPWPTEL